MKKFLLLLLCCVVSSNIFALSDFSGYGINVDPLKLAPNACYASKVNSSSPFGIIADGLDYDEMLNYLQASTQDPKYGSEFTAYINALSKNTDDVSQYDYAWLLGDDTSLLIQGYGLKALNKQGQEIYNTQKNLFDIKCGGYALSQYLNGSLITAALTIHFSNPAESEDYRIKTLSDPRMLYNRIQILQTLASQYKYSGTVTIQAIQLGGTPSALATTGMIKNVKGYYALTCNLEDMQKCIDATNGYYNYITHNYPEQIDTSTGKGLIPLLAELRDIPKRYLGL